MRKIVISFVVILTLILTLSATAYCMTDVSCVVNSDGVMNTYISSDFGKANYTIYILKPGYDIDSISEGITEGFAGVEEIQALEKESDKNLTDFVTFTFDTIAQNGTYSVVVGGGELDGRKAFVTYPSKSTEASAANALKGAALSEFESVLLSNEYQSVAWYIDTTCETYVNSKKAVLENMYYILKDTDYKTDDVVKAYKQALILAKLKDTAKEDFYKFLFINNANLGITYPDFVYEKEDEFINAFKNLCEDATLNTPSQLEALLKNAEALSKVNMSSRDTIISTLKDCNGIFELDFDGDFIKVDSYSLSKLLAAKIPFQNISEVRSAFAVSISELMSASNGGGSGGSSVSTVTGGKNASYTGFNTGTALTSPIIQQVENIEKFDDLSDAEWARPYIEYLNKNNIMSGDGNGKFRPNDFIKKEEFLKLICEALKIEEANEEVASFDDVNKEEWYYTYVERAVQYGIVKGKSENMFGAGEWVTRQDAAVMAKRAIDAAKSDLQNFEIIISFGDAEGIADYAKEAVEYLAKCGVLNGNENGEFLPCKSLTRAEAAKVIYSIIKSKIS